MWVEPHLPRVRSLWVYDSFRARIAFREVCNPPLRMFDVKHVNCENGAWRCPHLVSWFFFEILKGIVVNWLIKSLHPSTTMVLLIWERREHRREGWLACTSYLSVCDCCTFKTLWGWGKLPCKAPPKHWAREDTRPHMLVWVHGIRTSPFYVYVYVVCVCVDIKVVKPPHPPRARSPLELR